jgi:hypothetical protein
MEHLVQQMPNPVLCVVVSRRVYPLSFGLRTWVVAGSVLISC